MYLHVCICVEKWLQKDGNKDKKKPKLARWEWGYVGENKETEGESEMMCLSKIKERG